jgi:chemotaxis protein methyltransferase CheR
MTSPHGPAAAGYSAAGTFELGDDDFRIFRALIREHTGINLGPEKRALVQGRLSRRLRALGLQTFREYRDCLANDRSGELSEFRNAITTNLTSFFRETHHFQYLADQFLRPKTVDAAAARRMRIWSAGCSTGEEPYSIAMTVAETLKDPGRWDLRILATDLDTDVLATAERGVYSADRLRSISGERRARFFQSEPDSDTQQYRVAPELRRLISFRPLNLMHELPMKGPLDVIFCRNVVIYFDKETQRELFARMARLQRPGDLLFLGHSENIARISTDYQLLSHTVHQRI